MDVGSQPKPRRLPRFNRTAEPPAFRLTKDDVEIVHLVARHRFLRSTHIAALVGRSLDRTNDRLRLLYHAGYVDRPRAQLDFYPTSGSGPMVYAIADRGARLFAQAGVSAAGLEWSRKNRNAGRPFIEHQLEIMDFYVGLQLGARRRQDIRLIHPDELAASFPESPRGSAGSPFGLRVRLQHNGVVHDVGIVPDLAFGLKFPDGSRRCFLVEIDRGTMPLTRSDLRQSSFERKTRAYVTAQAERHHERRFGWKAFRVLTVTIDDRRLQGMMEVARAARVPGSIGSPLFFFASRDQLLHSNPLEFLWIGGDERRVALA